MSTKYQEFPDFLYRKFSFLKEHRIEDVVEGLNELGQEVSVSTFRKYVRGEFSFPPDLIGPLYTVTQDPDFLNYILKDTDMRLAPRSRNGSDKGAEHETLDVCAAVGRLSAAVEAAKANDGEIDDIEAARIMKGIEQAHKELGDLRLCIKKSRGGSA